MIKEAQNEDPLGRGAGPEQPKPVRYRTNDSSYEAIGALLVSNPAGLLVERDELISLLKHLDREEQCVARGFYLSGWAGTQPYTFDRRARTCACSDSTQSPAGSMGPMHGLLPRNGTGAGKR